MFTDRYIRSLKPESKIKDIREKNGFGIRVKPDGTKIFFYRYTSPVTGARRFLTLGGYPEHSLETARIKYGTAYKTVKAGGDPLETAQQEQAAFSAAPTFKELGADYIKRYAEVNKKSWLEDQRILEKELYPTWGLRKAQDITKGDIIALLDKVVDRGSPQTANNIFKIIRKMFNWAVKKDRLKISPCTGIDMPAPLTSKDRTLSETEIKNVWGTLEGITPELSITNAVKQALKLILLTAQRPGEVSAIHTREIDGNWWTIPAERSKNGKAHRVYLSPLVQNIITEAKAEAKAAKERAEIRNAKETRRKAILVPEDQVYSGFLFPSPRRYESIEKGGGKVPDEPIDRHALSKALKNNQSEDGMTTLGIATFTPHDLRRTAATFMSEMGEMDEVIDAVLNHAKQGVIKIYNLNKYDKEKQKALEAWGQKLISLISVEQVTGS